MKNPERPLRFMGRLLEGAIFHLPLDDSSKKQPVIHALTESTKNTYALYIPCGRVSFG